MYEQHVRPKCITRETFPHMKNRYPLLLAALLLLAGGCARDPGPDPREEPATRASTPRERLLDDETSNFDLTLLRLALLNRPEAADELLDGPGGFELLPELTVRGTLYEYGGCYAIPCRMTGSGVVRGMVLLPVDEELPLEERRFDGMPGCLAVVDAAALERIALGSRFAYSDLFRMWRDSAGLEVEAALTAFADRLHKGPIKVRADEWTDEDRRRMRETNATPMARGVKDLISIENGYTAIDLYGTHTSYGSYEPDTVVVTADTRAMMERVRGDVANYLGAFIPGVPTLVEVYGLRIHITILDSQDWSHLGPILASMAPAGVSGGGLTFTYTARYYPGLGGGDSSSGSGGGPSENEGDGEVGKSGYDEEGNEISTHPAYGDALFDAHSKQVIVRMLDRIKEDCIGGKLVSFVKEAGVTFKFREAPKLKASASLNGDLIVWDFKEEYKNPDTDLSYIIFEELFHIYQIRTEQYSADRKLNNEIEAKLAAYQYANHTGINVKYGKSTSELVNSPVLNPWDKYYKIGIELLNYKTYQSYSYDWNYTETPTYNSLKNGCDEYK